MFALIDVTSDADGMTNTVLYSMNEIETLPAARSAALAGTRELIRQVEFDALAALLLDLRVVSPLDLATMMQSLADKMIGLARGQLESEFATYPAELFDRARSLSTMAAKLRNAPKPKEELQRWMEESRRQAG